MEASRTNQWCCILRKNHLFDIRPDDDPKKEFLPENMALQFHRTTAWLLFLCLSPRPDIQTAALLVRQPDMDDWEKLCHSLRYLNCTLHMKRHLSADNLTNVLWWIHGLHGCIWTQRVIPVQ